MTKQEQSRAYELAIREYLITVKSLKDTYEHYQLTAEEEDEAKQEIVSIFEEDWPNSKRKQIGFEKYRKAKNDLLANLRDKWDSLDVDGKSYFLKNALFDYVVFHLKHNPCDHNLFFEVAEDKGLFAYLCNEATDEEKKRFFSNAPADRVVRYLTTFDEAEYEMFLKCGSIEAIRAYFNDIGERHFLHFLSNADTEEIEVFLLNDPKDHSETYPIYKKRINYYLNATSARVHYLFGAKEKASIEDTGADDKREDGAKEYRGFYASLEKYKAEAVPVLDDPDKNRVIRKTVKSVFEAIKAYYGPDVFSFLDIPAGEKRYILEVTQFVYSGVENVKQAITYDDIAKQYFEQVAENLIADYKGFYFFIDPAWNKFDDLVEVTTITEKVMNILRGITKEDFIRFFNFISYKGAPPKESGLEYENVHSSIADMIEDIIGEELKHYAYEQKLLDDITSRKIKVKFFISKATFDELQLKMFYKGFTGGVTEKGYHMTKKGSAEALKIRNKKDVKSSVGEEYAFHFDDSWLLGTESIVDDSKFYQQYMRLMDQSDTDDVGEILKGKRVATIIKYIEMLAYEAYDQHYYNLYLKLHKVKTVDIHSKEYHSFMHDTVKQECIAYYIKQHNEKPDSDTLIRMMAQHKIIFVQYFGKQYIEKWIARTEDEFSEKIKEEELGRSEGKKPLEISIKYTDTYKGLFDEVMYYFLEPERLYKAATQKHIGETWSEYEYRRENEVSMYQTSDSGDEESINILEQSKYGTSFEEELVDSLDDDSKEEFEAICSKLPSFGSDKKAAVYERQRKIIWNQMFGSKMYTAVELSAIIGEDVSNIYTDLKTIERVLREYNPVYAYLVDKKIAEETEAEVKYLELRLKSTKLKPKSPARAEIKKQLEAAIEKASAARKKAEESKKKADEAKKNIK